MWGGLVVSGLFVGVSYYALAFARSVRKRIQRLNGQFDSVEACFESARAELSGIRRAVSMKMGAGEVEAVYSAFAKFFVRRKLVVRKRG